MGVEVLLKVVDILFSPKDVKTKVLLRLLRGVFVAAKLGSIQSKKLCYFLISLSIAKALGYRFYQFGKLQRVIIKS